MNAVGSRLRVGAAWTVPVVCVALLAAAAVLAAGSGPTGQVGTEAVINIPLSIGFGLLGALVTAHRPGNRLGRLYLVVGLACALTLFCFYYAHVGLVARPGSLPAAAAVAWVSSWVWALGLIPALTLGLLLYPDGLLPSPRWRPAAAAAAAAVLVPVLIGALRPGPLLNHPVRDNPLGVPGASPVLDALGALGFPLFLAAFAASVAALAVRWRRAERAGVVRKQITLLLAVAVVMLGTVVVDPGGGTGEPAWVVGMSVVVVGLAPAAIGVAILRHRLYDIDVVLNRALVYGLLTGLAIALYVGVLVTAGSLLALTSPVTAAVATGVVAAAVLPLHAALQRVVNRLMYGDRADPWQALARLTAQLEGASAPGAALAGVVTAISTSLRLPYVAVQTSAGVVAEAGRPGPRPLTEFPITAGGEPMGTLLVAGRDRRPLRERDRAIIVELARHAGAAVQSAQLTDALHSSRQQLVTAREEERRRLRRDLHDGLGPTLAGIALGLDQVNGLVRTDHVAAGELIAELKAETTSSIADVRRVVYGLRPPALDEFGLLGALDQHVQRLRDRHRELTIDLDVPDELPPLPAAAEVAAYRIAVEASTNVARHARARRCTLRLRLPTPDNLEVAVLDDGVGIDGAEPGVGLAAMRERAGELGGRCTITGATDGGTQVCASIPVTA